MSCMMQYACIPAATSCIYAITETISILLVDDEAESPVISKFVSILFVSHRQYPSIRNPHSSKRLLCIIPTLIAKVLAIRSCIKRSTSV